MEKNFFEQTKGLRSEIKKNIDYNFEKIKDSRIKEILLQRQKTSVFIKGISSYYIHRGLNGPFSDQENINFSATLETYLTGLVILDNIVDSHEIRNEKTTYLKEYGFGLNTLASHYAIHLGLIKLVPHIHKFQQLTQQLGSSLGEEAIFGMISMDIDHLRDSKSAIESIKKVNGITLGVPLALTASTATNNLRVIYDVLRYGTNTGIAFGLYEELRDLMGEHGRQRASEIKKGRMPYCLIVHHEENPQFRLEEYVGRDLTEKKYSYLIKELRDKGVLYRNANIIKNYLEKGREPLHQHLNRNDYKILDSLRTTIENQLESLL